MKISHETLFVGLTDPVEKEKLFTKQIEYNLELGIFCDPVVLSGPWQRIVAMAKKVFKKYPVKRHLHGPFWGLQYDAKDPDIRAVCKQKIERVIQIAGMLNAEHVVVHSTFNPLDPDKGYAEEWLKRSTEFWKSLVPLARKKNCMLVIENIFDETPENILKLIAEVDSPFFKGCLDIGHANLFGKISIADWLEGYKKELFHLHLHDNFGKTDDHLAIGTGTCDFDSFFKALEQIRHIPACTIEVINEEEFLKSLAYLKERNLLEE